VRRRLKRLVIRHAPALAARHLRLDHSELGLCGEELAAHYLRSLGWRLLGRRLQTAVAEIDIVAHDGRELVCVEVKTSRALVLPRARGGRAIEPARRWRPGDRLSARQLAVQRRAARMLVRRFALASERARIDLVEVELQRTRAARIEHHRDVRTETP